MVKVEYKGVLVLVCKIMKYFKKYFFFFKSKGKNKGLFGVGIF